MSIQRWELLGSSAHLLGVGAFRAKQELLEVDSS